MLIDEFDAELKALTRFLLEQGLLNSYNPADKRSAGHGVRTIEASYWASASRTMGNIRYPEMFSTLTRERSFDFQFLDGALMRFQYEFQAAGRGDLTRSSVSFLPSPDLTSFQDDPDLYLHDVLYGEVVDHRTVTVPLRFDYDSRAEVAVDLHHPVAHLTLGAYKHCRIPMASAASPHFVVEFVLRSFYRTKSRHWTDELPRPHAKPLTPSITRLEQSYLHVALPTA